MSDSAAGREQWAAAAAGWARALEQPDSGPSAAAAEWMLHAADLRTGEEVLEVACGAGRVGLQAAEAVGDAGHVLCSDYAEPMVDAVATRAARLGLTNVEAQVLDALELDMACRFDVVLCRFGYMLMTDPQRAITKSAAALKPGGRLVLAVWGSGEANPWLSSIFSALMDHFGAPPPAPGTPGPFALADQARLQALLEEAGLTDIETDELTSRKSYESVAGWWQAEAFELGGPLAIALKNVPEADREAIQARAMESMERFLAPDGSLMVPASVVVARAATPVQ
jgi:SAM-dependent methyltransferase